MHSGLKPSVRAFKGVGFNRALPAAFGFGNGCYPDGVNDNFDIPNLVGKDVPNEFTFEMFLRNLSDVDVTNDGFFEFGGANGHVLNLELLNTVLYSRASLNPVQTWGSDLFASASASYLGKGLYHFFFSWNYLLNRQLSVIHAPNLVTPRIISPSQALPKPDVFTSFRLLVARGRYLSVPFDEVRLYKKSYLTTDAAISNYNNGFGENPQETEYLIGWYKFEAFEMLTTGDTTYVGMRDHSGNENHLRANNMVSDPTNPAYVLKPF